VLLHAEPATGRPAGPWVRPESFWIELRPLASVVPTSGTLGCALLSGDPPRWMSQVARVGHAVCPAFGDYFPRANVTNPSLFGILTFGSVCASITSFSPMMSLIRRRYATTA